MGSKKMGRIQRIIESFRADMQFENLLEIRLLAFARLRVNHCANTTGDESADNDCRDKQ